MCLVARMVRVLVFLNCCFYFAFCDRSDPIITDEGFVTRDQELTQINTTNLIHQNFDFLLDDCKRYFICFTYRMLNDINKIIKSDTFNLTRTLSFDRIPSNTVQTQDLSEFDEDRQLLDAATDDYGRLSEFVIDNTYNIFRTHTLNWNALPGVTVKVFRSKKSNALDAALEIQEYEEESRTFGARRKIMMALLPMMYKMGVMTTMLGGLIILALKGLTIGVILLILSFGNFIYKFKNQGTPWYPHHPTDIHVHVHTDGHKQAYSGWHYGPLATDHSDVYEH